MTEENKSTFLMFLFESQDIPDGTIVYYLVDNGYAFFISAWKVNRTMGLLWHTAFYLGPSTEAQKYSYKLSFSKPSCEDFIEIKCPCQPMEENYTMKHYPANSVPIHRSILKDCFEPEGIDFYIDIE